MGGRISARAGSGGGRVSKEHAYAYEAGYRDGSVHYELEHCPACKNVADLQEALAENDKLRELVRDMLPFAKVGMDDSCVTRRCYLYEQCITTVGGKCLIEAHMLDRMRELGVDE